MYNQPMLDAERDGPDPAYRVGGGGGGGAALEPVGAASRAQSAASESPREGLPDRRHLLGEGRACVSPEGPSASGRSLPRAVAGEGQSRFEPRCRLCQYSAKSPAIAAVVLQVAQQGMGERAAARRLAPLVEAHGLRPISARAVGRHLDRHVVTEPSGGDERQAKAVVAMETEASVGLCRQKAEAEATSGTTPTGDEWELLPGAGHATDEPHADRLRRLADQIGAAVESYVARLKSGGCPPLSGQELAMISAAAGRAAGLLESVARIRRADAELVRTLRAHTRLYAEAILKRMAPTVSEIHAELVADPATGQTAERFASLWNGRTPRAFVDAAAEALETTQKELKIGR